MKNFTLNVIMALIMAMGMSQNVYAAPLYDTLEEAQAALDKGVHDANDLAREAMDAEVFEQLKDAIIKATAVWDSDLRNYIDEIEKVMPALNEAMDKAKESVAEYKPLNTAIDSYQEDVLLDIIAVSEELEEKYEDNEEMWNTLSDAIEKYKTYLDNTLTELKGKADAEMLAAANDGIFKVMTFLEKYNIKLLSVREVMEKVVNGENVDEILTGIAHVVAAPSVNNTAYSLSGNKVSNGYKGIVIKGGKKIIQR